MENFKRHLYGARCLVFASITLVLAAGAQADPGLLIIAHGAPMKAWNAPVLELGSKVAAEAKKGGTFKAVRTAMLEFTEPDVPSMVAELEAEGCDRIIAVPLFIAPSGHSLFDIPTVLGAYSSPAMKALIAEEGGRVASPKVPITLTQTLYSGDALLAYAVDEVKRLSTNPKEEALVVLAHGDENHPGPNEDLLRRITTYCCGQSGIDHANWGFVEMGQAYGHKGLPLILDAGEAKKRVLVVGIYVSSSAKSIHGRGMMMVPKMMGEDSSKALEGIDVVFSEEGFVKHPKAVQWVLDAAQSALDPLPKKRS